MKWKIVRWLLLAGVVAGLVRYVTANAHEFRFILDIRAELLIVLFALHFTILVLMAFAFYRVARGFGLRIPFHSWLHVYSTSRLLNAIVPQTANAYRVVKLKASYGFPIASYAGTFVVFSFLSRLCTLVLVLSTVLVLAPDLRVAGISVAFVLAMACTAIAVAMPMIVLLQRRYRGAIQRALASMRVRPTLPDEVLRELRRPKLLFFVFGWTSLNYCLSLLAHWLCFTLIRSDVTVAEIATFRLVRNIVEIFPLTPGNLGIAEAAYGVLSTGLERPASEGIVVGGLITLMSICSVVAAYLASSVVAFSFGLKQRYMPTTLSSR